MSDLRREVAEIMCGGGCSAEHWDEALERADEIIRLVWSRDEWQPIEKVSGNDLFDSNGYSKNILVYIKDHGCHKGMAMKLDDGVIVFKAFGFHGDWEITHWMPLPDPQKE